MPAKSFFAILPVVDCLYEGRADTGIGMGLKRCQRPAQARTCLLALVLLGMPCICQAAC